MAAATKVAQAFPRVPPGWGAFTRKLFGKAAIRD
jgi:hypothetical protein